MMRLVLLAFIATATLNIRPAAADGYADGQAARMRGDYAEAVRIWRPLAEQGDAGSQNGLGVLYQNGEGVQKNSAEAMMWYQRAAAQGFSKALYNIGYTYETEGDNFTEAARWYSKAAAQSFAPAQYKLGRFFRYGHGVPRDPTKAARYFRLASIAGIARAQIALGDLLMFGDGLPQDFAASYVWYEMAASNADSSVSKKATTEREWVEQLMNDKQLELAKALAAACLRSSYQKCP
jgi:TPR repeat protein